MHEFGFSCYPLVYNLAPIVAASKFSEPNHFRRWFASVCLALPRIPLANGFAFIRLLLLAVNFPHIASSDALIRLYRASSSL